MSEWFFDAPEMLYTSVDVVRREWRCPEAGCTGTMVFNGFTWPTSDPGYHHACTVCGKVRAIHGHQFPEITYKPRHRAPEDLPLHGGKCAWETEKSWPPPSVAPFPSGWCHGCQQRRPCDRLLCYARGQVLDDIHTKPDTSWE